MTTEHSDLHENIRGLNEDIRRAVHRRGLQFIRPEGPAPDPVGEIATTNHREWAGYSFAVGEKP
jgi:hypothetical protein